VVAESEQHHPDIFIYGWNKVRVMLTSHDAGGLTEKDFNMASKIDDLNF
jgi:4a-hydroxytetrahydrobiopterin dehydratase